MKSNINEFKKELSQIMGKYDISIGIDRDGNELVIYSGDLLKGDKSYIGSFIDKNTYFFI